MFVQVWKMFFPMKTLIANLNNVNVYINNSGIDDIKKNKYYEINKNFINLKNNNNCAEGCKITFAISSSNSDYNYYYIYLFSKNKFLDVKKIMNIYGNLNGNMIHKFQT